MTTPEAAPAPADAPQQEPDLSIDELRGVLAPFFESNPTSEIGVLESPGGNRIAIKNPWGDESVAIGMSAKRTSKTRDALIEALNSVHLPPRFTAIWHRDSKDLEFIWTAYPLTEKWKEVPGRSFVFKYDGRDYACEFAGSSERLIKIARHALPQISSRTNYRNLHSFSVHALRMKAADSQEAKLTEATLPETEPRSFWIRDIEWNEDTILDVAHHLNFYLTYYDTISPFIEIHNAPETDAIKPQARYIIGKFPDRIDSRPLDDNLLQLWMACRQGDEARRFLYCFRTIEYASFTYLDGKARSEIRQILSAPHASSNITETTELIAAAIQKSKLDDVARFQALLEEVVRPSILWKEIALNLEAFTSPTKFDGGFELKALMAKETTEAQFASNGVDTFGRRIREMRNALSHGKENHTAGVITPTVKNFTRIRPWIAPITVVAAQVILSKGLF